MTDTPYLFDLHDTLVRTGGITTPVGVEYATILAQELRSLGVSIGAIRAGDEMHIELSVSGVRVKADLEISALEH